MMPDDQGALPVVIGTAYRVAGRRGTVVRPVRGHPAGRIIRTMTVTAVRTS